MIEMVLVALTIALSLVLAGISFMAYRKSHLRPALYLLIAFLLLALKKVIEGLKLASWIERDVGVITGLLEVLILGLLVLSLWRR
ncbi:hypothetical protein A3L11_01430 [Thermococcus siculi]|uniref:Uncharacterized protein n=1 Tax=Thermococcus siculi TaxID=72803 RepID=A0A2Z2MJK6_9EURY|nr:hypothetical protein [Thermococcus siculi]ASJ07958.1 hypothetical protein A3L11_01430 [Thermococcus siculi]